MTLIELLPKVRGGCAGFHGESRIPAAQVRAQPDDQVLAASTFLPALNVKKYGI